MKKSGSIVVQREGFSLAEMMVVMLVLSIVMAASMPIMTRRTKVSEAIWKYMTNGSDIYYGEGDTQSAAIGSSTLPLDADSKPIRGKLVLNAAGGDANQIVFTTAGVYTGHLKLNSVNSIALGKNAGSGTQDGAIAIGNEAGAFFISSISIGSNAISRGTSAIAIGANAFANRIGSLAIGYNSTTNSSSTHATALGSYSNALADNTIAIGRVSNASDDYCIALGYDANSNAYAGVSVGAGAKAGDYSASVGPWANASGKHSTAFGGSANASANYSVAIGPSANASSWTVDAEDSIAIGNSAKASGNVYGVAIGIGNNSNAAGTKSIAIGNYASTTPSGSMEIAIGNYAYSGNTASIAIGNYATAIGCGSIALGSGVNTTFSDGLQSRHAPRATGFYSIAIGSNANASTSYAMAIGKDTTATGLNSSALGDQASALGNYSIAMGLYSNAESASSIAIGSSNPSKNNFGAHVYSGSDDSIAIGRNAYVEGSTLRAIAIGSETYNSGSNSMNIGYQSGNRVGYYYGSGGYSIAIGSYSVANGLQSIAIGNYATASNYVALALGDQAIASGRDAVAVGYVSRATGGWSTAVGTSADALATHATALGLGANASGDYSMALGSDSSVLTAANSVAIGSGATITGGLSHMVVIGPGVQVNMPTSSENLIYIGNTYYTVRLGGALAVSAGGVTAWSDRRLKNIKGYYKSGLDIIRNIKTFKYSFKDDKKNNIRVGIIAQDLQKLLPEAIAKNEEGFLTYKTEYITFTMFNAIQELDAIVQKLSVKVDTIDNKIASIIKATQINAQQIKNLENENQILEKRIVELEKYKKESGCKNNNFDKRIKLVETKLAHSK